MKKLISALLVIVVACGVSSCRNDLDAMADGNYRLQKKKEKPVMKTISMSFGGDFITESEEPLLRADDGDVYTAINVFRTEKDVEGATEEKYAYGLFKNKESMQIDVVTGFTYRFESTILIEREDKVFNNRDGVLQYLDPFRTVDDNSLNFLPGSGYPVNLLDAFQYTNTIEDGEQRKYFYGLAIGTAEVDAGSDPFSFQYGNVSYPRVKRFYGTVGSFDPGLTNEVNIVMDYKCFGLKIEVNDVPSGYLTVKDITKDEKGNAKQEKEGLIFTKSLQLAKGDTWEGVFSMNQLLAESESFTLEFTWNKGGNVKETFTSEVTVHPKMKKILRLNVTGTPNYSTKGNITFTMDSETLTDEEVQYENP